MVKFLASLVLTLWLSSAGWAQTCTFVTWNSLNFSTSQSSQDRVPHFQTVLDSIMPDILVMQEIHNLSGADLFHSAVLEYSMEMAPFIDGYLTDNALYYNADEFTSLETTAIKTELRDITQFVLVHLATGDTLRIFSLHLKASKGSTNRARRLQEVDSLRKVTDAFWPDTHFMVCGDFNFYGANEPAYTRLLESDGPNGHFVDPIPMSGTWNAPYYAPYHTQSTRTRSFGGGATGGLDDRFDLILFSSQFFEPDAAITYEMDSTRPFGNTGLVYNDSINAPSNTAIPAAMANALHYASDHLPVVARITFHATTDATAHIPHQAPRAYPNPSTGWFTIEPHTDGITRVLVSDALGRIVGTYATSGTHRLDLTREPNGMYFLKFPDAPTEKVLKLLKY